MAATYLGVILVMEEDVFGVEPRVGTLGEAIAIDGPSKFTISSFFEHDSFQYT